MNQIYLQRVVPDIFDKQNIDSQIWNRDIILKRGEKYLVKAESGRGKSSLCSFLMGYRRDYQGEILFDSETIRSFDVGYFHTLRQNSLAYIPQGLMLFDELSALDNILIKNDLTQYKSLEWIMIALERLGLEDRAHFPIQKLSFGQKQRVAIIKALCQPADFLILDEPISHLDDKAAHIVSQLISEELNKGGAGLIALSIGREFDFNYNLKLNM